VKKIEERKKKTKGIMQVEPDTGQTAYTPTGSVVQVEPTDVQVHPGQTAHLPTGSSMQTESLIQTACTPPSLATQQPETALPPGQLKPEEGTTTEKELSALQLADTVDRFLPEQQVHDFRPKPETEIETSERSVLELCEQRSYREEPATKRELQTKERKVLQNDSEDSEIDHVTEHINDGTEKGRRKRMQKRARLNIHRPRSQKARHS